MAISWVVSPFNCFTRTLLYSDILKRCMETSTKFSLCANKWCNASSIVFNKKLNLKVFVLDMKSQPLWFSTSETLPRIHCLREIVFVWQMTQAFFGWHSTFVAIISTETNQILRELIPLCPSLCGLANVVGLKALKTISFVISLTDILNLQRQKHTTHIETFDLPNIPKLLMFKLNFNQNPNQTTQCISFDTKEFHLVHFVCMLVFCLYAGFLVYQKVFQTKIHSMVFRHMLQTVTL